MTNQTLIQVPTSLTEPVILQRFLLRLVEELDIVLGFRGGDAASSQADLNTVVSQAQELLGILQTEVAELKATAAEQQIALADTFNRLLETTWLKAWVLKFIGRSTNGPVVLSTDYNIATGERIAAGVYEFTLAQNTFAGTTILDKITPIISWLIAPAAASDLFAIELSTDSLPAGTFQLNIFSVTQGAGNKLDVNPYDPIAAGDLVICSGALNIQGDLPPL